MGGSLRRVTRGMGALVLLAWAGAALMLSPEVVCAIGCTTPGSMAAADHDGLLAAANPLAAAVAAQNLDLLQSSLLPAVVGDWESIRAAIQAAKPLFQGGELRWRTSYLLDASDLKAPADTQFFCTNADNSLTVTVSLRSLPPGRYALLIGDYAGTPLAGQLGIILGMDPGSGGKWKLGGFYAREGEVDGHDGIWFWTHAREAAKKNQGWSAWFSYDAARWLLTPVDFLSSPNLEKLNAEQLHLASPADSLPLTVSGAGADAGKSWRITAARFDTALHSGDLGLTYEGAGITEPVAARAEAVAVMSALLRLHPGLRESFHGLWAYAVKDGRQSFAIELAMKDIP